jgi:hypothetical protein
MSEVRQALETRHDLVLEARPVHGLQMLDQLEEVPAIEAQILSDRGFGREVLARDPELRRHEIRKSPARRPFRIVRS